MNPLLPASLALLLAAAACQTSRPRLDEASYPGTLLPAAALPVEAVWRQTVTASWQQPGQAPQQRSFDAAVQRQGDRLTVLGLSPMGSLGFSITQGPDGIEVENHMQEQLAIPPRFVLLDVQRTLYPYLPETNADGSRTVERDGERIRERRQRGRLVERTFERLDGEPAGAITIDYEWAEADWLVPSRAVLDNGWFGYRLTIVTHSEQRLPPASATATGAGQ